MKKLAVFLSLVIFLFAGITVAAYTARSIPVTYNSAGADVKTLMQNFKDRQSDKAPDEKTEAERNLPAEADGVASVIVATDLSETEATNDVASIVFDYRGYDTMGESFILLTAIAGSYIILKTMKGRKEEDDDEE